MQQLEAELIEAELIEAAEDLGVPGVSAGVLHGHRRMIVSHGITGADHGRPVDESTLFQIGSTAKTLTATAIMVLVEQGVVDLTDLVRRHLPDLGLRDPGAVDTLEVGHLLNHTAGWEGGDAWTDTGEGDDALARAAALAADLPQQFPPGGGASYNNAAFVLAGRLLEVKTGLTFEHALHRLVLAPLGLGETLTSLNEIMTRPFALGHDVAAGAERQLDVHRPWSDPRGYLPAGARIVSSTRDLLIWAQFQLGDGRAADGTRLLAEQRLRMMQTPSTPHEVMPSVGVGYGWLLRDIDGVRLVEHHGDVAGQHSTITVVPERDCAVVVLTNAAPSGRELAERIVNRVLEDELGLVASPPALVALSAEELATYIGTYRTQGIELRIQAEGSALVIHGTVFDGEAAGQSLDFPIGLLAGERFLVTEGPFAGLQGEFVRAAGALVAVRHVGRLVPRVSA